MGLYGIEGYWFKKLTPLIRCKVEQMLDENEWESFFCQKDPNKGNNVGNFWSFSYLLLFEKGNSIISSSTCKYLVNGDILPNEERGCTCKWRGTSNWLIIDKVNLDYCKQKL